MRPDSQAPGSPISPSSINTVRVLALGAPPWCANRRSAATQGQLAAFIRQSEKATGRPIGDPSATISGDRPERRPASGRGPQGRSASGRGRRRRASAIGRVGHRRGRSRRGNDPRPSCHPSRDPTIDRGTSDKWAGERSAGPRRPPSPRPASPKPAVSTSDDVAIRVTFLMRARIASSNKRHLGRTCECVRWRARSRWCRGCALVDQAWPPAPTQAQVSPAQCPNARR